jgi:hypothetical protein
VLERFRSAQPWTGDTWLEVPRRRKAERARSPQRRNTTASAECRIQPAEEKSSDDVGALLLIVAPLRQRRIVCKIGR